MPLLENALEKNVKITTFFLPVTEYLLQNKSNFSSGLENSRSISTAGIGKLLEETVDSRLLSAYNPAMWTRMRREMELQLSFAKRRLRTLSLRRNRDSKVLLHIGCGTTNSPEFINIDARPLAHVHIPTDDITSLGDFETGTVDLAYMCHVLEHIRKNDLKNVLLEMNRALKEGGVLRISVPDFDKLIEVYDRSGKDVKVISNQLMGGQDHEHNIHYSVFYHARLAELLKEVGFREIVPWDPENCEHRDFRDRASRRMKVNGKEIMISLNLEAIK